MASILKVKIDVGQMIGEEVTMDAVLFLLTYGLIRVILPVIVLLTIGTLIQRHQSRAHR
jgi:hypothetical protein